MGMFGSGSLLLITIILYLTAAGAALVLRRRQRLQLFAAQGLSMLAGISGAGSALVFLLSGAEDWRLTLLDTDIPFLKVELAYDGLSAFFVLILSLVAFCVSLYSMGYLTHYIGKRNVCAYQLLAAGFVLSMLLVFVAANSILFFMAWEAMAILSYFLVVFESEEAETRKAGLIYIVMTHISAALLLVALLLIYQYTGSFDLSGSGAGIPENIRNLLFLLFLVGFGTKGGIAPLHIWLPRAHPAAPGPVSALMSGVMIKTAVYGLLRFVLDYLGDPAPWWGAALLALGVFSAAAGVLYAFISRNIKRMLAHSSVENMGILFIGIGIVLLCESAGAGRIAALALLATLLHCLFHAMYKSSLFLSAGSVHWATHTKNLEELGGLIKGMPMTAALCLGGAMSLAALVPFSGFVSEWLLFQSILSSFVLGQAGLNILLMVTAAALAMAAAVSAGSMVKLFGISFLGRPRSVHAETAKEVPAAMNAAIGLLVGASLCFGLFPRLAVDLSDGVVQGIQGVSVSGQLSGRLLTLSFPLDINPNVLSPVLALAVGGGLVLLSLLALRAFGGKNVRRAYGTWDCGFAALTPRMQYSGRAFSKPLKIVFRMFVKSTRELRYEGDSPYHPTSIEYQVKTESSLEKYVYLPFIRGISAFSEKLKFMIQTGSVHAYLLYIFIAVLVLMLYNRLG
jgi:formate hydrogenlyase subunit 3/multisubunit Na+/H+ antiporter MnhD subunit